MAMTTMVMMMMIPGQTFDGSVRYERPLHHPLKMAGLVTELKNLSHKNSQQIQSIDLGQN